MDYGVQLGRRFRSLKLWMVLRYFGQQGLAARIREHCRLARLFASWVKESVDWELLAPVHLSLVCFRFRPRGFEKEPSETELNALNEKIMNDINATGQIYLSHTKLGGRFTLRLAIGSIRTSERHVRKAWQLLSQAAGSCV
jgi:aromatic-L-amino-acid decarboxylase